MTNDPTQQPPPLNHQQDTPLTQQDDSQLDIQDCLFIVLERIWMIITILAISIIIAAIWSFQQTPLFKATSQIQIEPRNQTVVQTQAEVGPIADSTDEYYNTMVKVLQSRDIAIKSSNKLKEKLPNFLKKIKIIVVL